MFSFINLTNTNNTHTHTHTHTQKIIDNDYQLKKSTTKNIKINQIKDINNKFSKYLLSLLLFFNCTTSQAAVWQEIGGVTEPLPVSKGGTGLTSTTARGVLIGGTTTTGNFQNIGAGTSGQILRSNGSSANPSWTTIKTVNNQSLLGSGDISVGGGASIDWATYSSASTGSLFYLNSTSTNGGGFFGIKTGANSFYNIQHNTTLMWDDCQGGSLNWTNANNYCNNSTLHGFTDWRLPTLAETKASGVIGDGVPSCGSSWTWTSSKGGSNYYVWSGTSSYDYNSINSFQVRCVR